jgi:drug/metabolite transporter (DMT)-like permease
VNLGYLYMVLSLTSFGLIGIFAKFADTRGCRPSAVYTLAYGWSMLFSALFVVLFRGGSFHVPGVVYAIALPFGVASAIGGIVFMSGIRYGKISTSWLIINLSAAIPAIGSVLFYGEPVNPRKIAVLLLAVVSMLLLWKDKQEDERLQQAHEVMGKAE